MIVTKENVESIIIHTMVNFDIAWDDRGYLFQEYGKWHACPIGALAVWINRDVYEDYEIDGKYPILEFTIENVGDWGRVLIEEALKFLDKNEIFTRYVYTDCAIDLPLDFIRGISDGFSFPFDTGVWEDLVDDDEYEAGRTIGRKLAREHNS